MYLIGYRLNFFAQRHFWHDCLLKVLTQSGVLSRQTKGTSAYYETIDPTIIFDFCELAARRIGDRLQQQADLSYLNLLTFKNCVNNGQVCRRSDRIQSYFTRSRLNRALPTLACDIRCILYLTTLKTSNRPLRDGKSR